MSFKKYKSETYGWFGRNGGSCDYFYEKHKKVEIITFRKESDAQEKNMQKRVMFQSVESTIYKSYLLVTVENLALLFRKGRYNFCSLPFL